MKTNKDLIIEPNAAIEGRKYSEEKPWSCKYCYWWGGKKKGCSLKQCHYLLPEKKKAVKTTPCGGCPYGKHVPCIYKDAAETITGNCDTVLFLGGKESSTLKEISETLGKETIDLYNTSDTRGSNRSYGLNYQKTGKELMSRDELAVMDGEKCILQLRGVRPFLSNKYDITKHKRYKELADFNKNNAFDVEKYLAHRLVMSKDTEFEMYEVTVTQEDVSAIEAEESED